ncbi:AraC-like DNA-binding protein [Silvibacterium bohemicum]|uniref:AraC-like DNA-binding protein n=1 Tax=Silvibacterium bohemicum TaxID=1577686 RepID=A0A841JVG6_9BACT|nr:AraC family transcriptional regulator [Silvibacterium bohemicum]MBB6145140.1 AraC-like DNA-binding protein [Silvibacterium bohemicum]
MATSIEVPAVWNQIAENMYLNNSPTAEIQLSEVSAFSFGRLRVTKGLPDITRPVVGESGYIIALQLKAIPFVELFLGKKKVSSGYYPTGAVGAINLEEEPACFLPNPFDALALHVTQAALDEISYAHQMPYVDRLVWEYGTVDPVVHHLGQTLLSSLEHPDQTSKIFIDHVLQALNCHFVYSYGGVTISPRKFRGGLSPWQMRRAKELLEAHLDGNIALQQVAEACELSVSHFARAFKESFHKPPYRWLLERRVDQARDFMMNTRLPLADIAARCGFTDESALNRSFKRIYGITPGVWRRESNRSSGGLSSSSTKAFSSSVPRQKYEQVASSTL